MIDKEAGPNPTPCPRCGADASWRFIGDMKAAVEVLCPDCGKFEMPHAEFEQAVADMALPEDRE
jgi:predicted RNA-binding Zn-ribbon protein involved in translation (DUF1610 family)